MSVLMGISFETPPEDVQARLRRVLQVHFDPHTGTRYWLDRAADLGIDVLKRIRTLDDLSLLGEMTPEALSERPLLDYIPRRFHTRLDRFLVGRTGGFAGGGGWTAYRADEFEEAFVLPFLAAAAHVGFPCAAQWLFVGPGGAHIPGKVVRYLANTMGGMDAFAVDFDPGWARCLPEGSAAREQYLRHILSQSLEILQSQLIEVLFATPPMLRILAQAMSDGQRHRIRGVHYCGAPLASSELLEFQRDIFPAAVHLTGYGHALAGCCLELDAAPGRDPAYFPFGNRLILETVGESGARLSPGTPGKLRFTRLDESMLIVRCLTADQAVEVPTPEPAPEGFSLPGIRTPLPPRTGPTVSGSR